MTAPLATAYVIDTTSLPLGVHDIMVFNGFVFNDPWALERAKLSNVDGLMDSDLRDTREEYPDIDGEIAYAMYRGGRTVVLDGTLRAGNMHSLINLRQRLKAACATRDQKELWLNRYDLVEPFDSVTQFNSRYSFDNGSGTASPVGGLLIPSSTSFKKFYYDYHKYRNAQASYKFTVGATTAGSETSILLKRLVGSTDGIFVRQTGGSLTILKRDGGVDSSLATTSNGISAGNTYWIQGRIVGNDITVERWSSAPSAGGSPDVTTTWTLAGADATKYGTGILGYVGMQIQPPGTDWTYDDFEIDGIDPCDLVLLDVRRAGGMSGSEQADSYEYKRPFQVSLRAADPLLYSRYEDVLRATPLQSLEFGTMFDMAFDVNFNVPLDGVGAQTVSASGTITNRGDESSRPKFILKGPLSNVTIVNQTNGTSLKYTGLVNQGNDVTIDCRKWTVEDAQSADLSGAMDPAYGPLTLSPGANVLTMLSDTVDSNNSRVIAVARSAWS